MKHLLLAVLVSVSFNALAGDKGNGGDVIVCPASTQLLDVYEAQKKGITIKMGEGSVREKVNAVTNRMSKLDPDRATQFEKYANELLTELENNDEGGELKKLTVVSENLRDIDDSHDLSVPYDCTKEQLIIRRNPSEIQPYDIYQTEYVLNEILWRKLDENNKAMTVVHEVLYKMFDYGDSRFARHLNGLLSSSKAMTYGEYLKLIQGFKVNYQVPLTGDIAKFWLNPFQVKSPAGFGDVHFSYFKVKKDLVEFTSYSGTWVSGEKNVYTTIFYDLNGSLIGAVSYDGANWKEVSEYKNGSITYDGSQRLIIFDESGSIIGIESEKLKSVTKDGVKIKLKGKKVSIVIEKNIIKDVVILK